MIRTLSLCAVLTLATAAFAQKTEAEVRAVYSKMNVMIQKNDVNGLLALFNKTASPDFKATMGGHSIGRKQFAADLKKGLTMKDAPKGVSKIVSSKRVGKNLVLNVLWTIAGKGPDGKPFSMKMTSVNTWVPTAAGYRLKTVDEHIQK